MADDFETWTFAAMRDEIQTLRKALKEAADYRNRRLVEEGARLEKDRRESTNRLVDKATARGKEIQQLTEENVTLKAENAALGRLVDKATARGESANRLVDKNATLKAEAAELRRILNAYVDQRVPLEQENETLKASVARLQKDLAAKAEIIKDDYIDQLEEENAELRAWKDALKTENETLRASVARLQRNVAEAHLTIRALTGGKPHD